MNDLHRVPESAEVRAGKVAGERTDFCLAKISGLNCDLVVRPWPEGVASLGGAGLFGCRLVRLDLLNEGVPRLVDLLINMKIDGQVYLTQFTQYRNSVERQLLMILIILFLVFN